MGKLEPLVSIIIATMGRGYLRKCLWSIELYTPVPYEVVLVMPESVEFPFSTEYHPRIIREAEPRGCVAAYNKGFREGQGKFLCHLNDDMEVCPNWMTAMLELVGDRNVQGAFYLKEPTTNGFIVNSIYNRLYGNFSLGKKSLYEELGYWDEIYTHYGGDPDFSLKVWHAGYEVVATPLAKVVHHCINDGVRKEHLREADCAKLSTKWKGIFW